MRHWFCILTSAVLSIIPMAAAPKSVQERYIEKYAPMAVSEMYRSGVPASITLAQGMLESNNGESILATKGNNHFGIKCHNDWNGGKMYHDDDRKGECFRKYKSPSESFRDHSDFLRYRDRYKSLFDLRTTDYKGWAYGLKKAGYATDPAYPTKLIKLIEDYKLYEYDTKSASWARKHSDSESEDVKPQADVAKSDEGKAAADEKAVAQKKENRKVRRRSAKEQEPVNEIPESPLQIEQAVPLEAQGREVFRFPLSRQLYSQNGVPFIYSVEGETYASIAKAYNLFPREILKYNDLSSSQELAPGTVVYLQPKKKQSAKGLDKYVCEGGEDMRDIAQRFAVRLSTLYKINGIQPGHELREGDVLILRK
ncbi:MAG: glucosaminidase domain-containing protein [Candidatus Cryptobacteroides sp.]